ncbi:hypothetical protein CQ018_13335 [Arthrobacter sp. MYb227]|uniref:COG4315 family predicted lipoprotein n=1 Tax=Arthrobacter sp. MYb227 TaxID=1848601 RepID=UPI000CFE0323|nr:hypothetical protein [Arthrobacter sp. MYb227]PQZ91616.1 hypothetical protein CQ018_13335 [Arthrobacter sp. MYb227]
MNRNTRRNFAGSAALITAAALLLSGCAGNSPSNSSSTPAASSSAASPSASSSATTASPNSSAVDLKTATSSLGNIVVDGKGMSLYFYTLDTKGTTTSACTGACLEAWPIAVASSATPKIEGVTGTVSTITSPDGKLQLTLNGMPLYNFVQDSKPGDVLGQGVKDVWYLSTPAGEMIK